MISLSCTRARPVMFRNSLGTPSACVGHILEGDSQRTPSIPDNVNAVTSSGYVEKYYSPYCALAPNYIQLSQSELSPSDSAQREALELGVRTVTIFSMVIQCLPSWRGGFIVLQWGSLSILSRVPSILALLCNI